MSWTTPAELKAQLSRLWERGELPRLLVTGENRFPLRLVLKGPTPTDVTDRFEAVRGWVAELTTIPRCRFEWSETRHRIQGLQRLPEQAWIDTLDDAMALIGKRGEAERLAQVANMTRVDMPALLPWLARRPLQAIGLADRWLRLTAVVQWLVEHPRPGLYLRQVDIPGVDSKFIEGHRAVLAELFDLALPEGAIQGEWTGASHFANRYGFRDKPTRIRFRPLDDTHKLLPGSSHPDITLDADSFASLNLPACKVFITENETNFLAFPPATSAIVVFGAGYGWEALARARWLAGCAIHYWGDIDTHGFAILSQLRSRFEHVSSFLMDRPTLDAHEAHWGDERDQVRHDLPLLTPGEQLLFDDLRNNRIRRNLRLEQERVGYHWLTQALSWL